LKQIRLSFGQNQNDMRLFPAIVMAITIFLSLTACQKDIGFGPDNPTRPADPPAGMKAKVNGMEWTANRNAGATRLQGLINITGISNDKNYITITLADSGVHRYVLSDATFNVAAMVDSTEAEPFAYTSNQGAYPGESGGEVSITAIDTAKKTISGTFSFALFREWDGGQKTVTEGSFTNVAYITSLPPSMATDTFRVKIDGISWTPANVNGLLDPLLNQIVVNATDATAEKSVGLNFPSDISPGTYNLDFWSGIYVGVYNPDTDPLHSKAAVSGELVILEHNTATRRIRGTFHFRGEELAEPQNYAEISDGYFSVKY
jgi:hypothetical protein